MAAQTKGLQGLPARLLSEDEGQGSAALADLAALDPTAQAELLDALLTARSDEALWAALTASKFLRLGAEGALEVVLHDLVATALERGAADFELSEEAFRLLAHLDPPTHLTLSRTLAADPAAPPAHLAGVLVTLEALAPGEAAEVMARLARSQAQGAARSTGLIATQREEIARGALDELVRRGAAGSVREQLLANEAGAGRLWAAAALDAEGQLLGPTGLTTTESTLVAFYLANELCDSSQDSGHSADRLELLGALPFEARFHVILGGLIEGAAPDEVATQLLALAPKGVPETAGPELGAELLERARAAGGQTRRRLVDVLTALPERAAPAWQRAEAEQLDAAGR